MINVQTLEVVGRSGETKLQVGENLNKIPIYNRSVYGDKIFKKLLSSRKGCRN